MSAPNGARDGNRGLGFVKGVLDEQQGTPLDPRRVDARQFVPILLVPRTVRTNLDTELDARFGQFVEQAVDVFVNLFRERSVRVEHRL